MPEDKLTLQSLVENALHHRFTPDENWQDPAYLGQKFSAQQLEAASARARTFPYSTGRHRGQRIAFYEPEDRKVARELLREAKEIAKTAGTPDKTISSQVGSIQAGHIQRPGFPPEDGAQNPEAFYTELQKERTHRERIRSDQSPSGKEEGRRF